MMRKVSVALIAVLAMTLTAQVALATSKHHAEKEKPDATVRLSTGSFAVGVGFSWGSGVLTFHGKKYPFDINGLSVLDVGVSKATATGNVYHLTSINDFEGNYTAASAGATIAGGGSATAMQNQNGVVIRMTATTRGLKFKLAGEGVKITLKK
jgi:hypothetical protein